MYFDHGAHIFPGDRAPALFAPTPTHCRPALAPAFTSPYPFSSSAHHKAPVPIAAHAAPLLPLASSSAQPLLASSPVSASASGSGAGRLRPKLPKKASSSVTKARAVQCSLEVKVERAKGFTAFFVPLARAMPPAPPSSPVGSRDERGGGDYFSAAQAAGAHGSYGSHGLHPAHCSPGTAAQRHSARPPLLEPAPGLAAGALLQHKLASEERWVEDVDVAAEDGMEIDQQ